MCYECSEVLLPGPLIKLVLLPAVCLGGLAALLLLTSTGRERSLPPPAGEEGETSQEVWGGD